MTESKVAATATSCHILADLYGIENSLLKDSQLLMATCRRALDAAGVNVLREICHKFTQQGEGVTGMFLLAESHCAFHTYPEYQAMALDVFSCGSSDPEQVVSLMVDALTPSHVESSTQVRLLKIPLPTVQIGSVDLDGRVFTGISNYDEGEFTKGVQFRYCQDQRVIWAIYHGDCIRAGNIVGIVRDDGRLQVRWQHVNESLQFKTGTAVTTPRILDDGRICLFESWTIHGNEPEKGKSVVEEIRTK